MNAAEIQCGFDFDTADVVTPPQTQLSINDPTPWLHLEMPYKERRSYLLAAQQKLAALPPALERLYRAGILDNLELLDQHEAKLANGTASIYFADAARVHADKELIEAFCELCLKLPSPAIETRVRARYSYHSWACYVPEVGSLVFTRWKSAGSYFMYACGRSCHFQESFKDRRRNLQLDVAIWRHAYCAQRIAETRDGTPSVTPFEYGGRLYVTTSSSSWGGENYIEADGWSLLPASMWKERTFTQSKLYSAWDEGRIERGNDRGLRVQVRGKPFVFDEPVLVFDPNGLNRYHAKDQRSTQAHSEELFGVMEESDDIGDLDDDDVSEEENMEDEGED